MQFISGDSTVLHPDLMVDMARYRHNVFVKKLGWQLQCQDSLEYDQFDREDTVYVVAQNEASEVIGTARLLPTTRPYLLGDVFPQLLHGAPPPSSPDVWELSRFAAVDFSGGTGSALDQFSSPIMLNLLRTSMACAAARGAKRFITVSPIGVERLLRRLGIRAHRLAPPVIVDGHPIFACSIAFDSE